MKKSFLPLLILSLVIPSFILAQSTVEKLPQNVQDFINSTPGVREELDKAYNTNIDFKSAGIVEQISFSVSPSVPRPNQLVTAKIASYSSDLNRLQISWYVNDQLVKKEVGATQHEFLIGDLGKLTKLRVVILKLDGSTLEKNYTFRPAEVDLIYEAQTFTPPFYEGKAYFSRQSSVKISAMPQALNKNGQFIDPKNIIYKWYVDGSVIQDQSGYGKQSFLYTGKLLSKSVKIGVDISTIEEGSVANSSIFINPVTPEVLIYEKSPTLGTLYNKIVSDNFSINKPEIEFEASPFSFKKDSVLNLSTIYEWSLNGSKINSPNQSSLVFRNEENKQGQASIGVSVSNETILQKNNSAFGLIFGESNTTNDARF